MTEDPLPSATCRVRVLRKPRMRTLHGTPSRMRTLHGTPSRMRTLHGTPHRMRALAGAAMRALVHSLT